MNPKKPDPREAEIDAMRLKIAAQHTPETKKKLRQKAAKKAKDDIVSGGSVVRMVREDPRDVFTLMAQQIAEVIEGRKPCGNT